MHLVPITSLFVNDIASVLTITHEVVAIYVDDCKSPIGTVLKSRTAIRRSTNRLET